MFKNLYLELTFIKRSKKSKAPAMKKRPHLRAIVQRVLTMKPDSVSSVSTATLFITPLKSLVLDTIRITDHFRYPHSITHSSKINIALLLFLLSFFGVIKN